MINFPRFPSFCHWLGACLVLFPLQVSPDLSRDLFIGAGASRTSATDTLQQDGSEEPRLGDQDLGQRTSTGGQGATTKDVLASAQPIALAAWQRMLAVSHPEAQSSGAQQTPPPNSFHLEANVITRDGSSTNQLDVDYRFLSPHYVRFLLPSNRQTGRGTGTGTSAYWLKDGDQVQRLDTRENIEDRRLVKEMTALARNFLALTDPNRIRLTRLELLDGPPVALPKEVRAELAGEVRRAARANDAEDRNQTGNEELSASVTWIRIQTPDFDLARRGNETQDARHDQLVSMALGPRGLPLVAMVQDPNSPSQALDSNASLILLGSWVQEQDDHYLIPRRIRVFRPELVPNDRADEESADDVKQTWLFGKQPVQDIGLKKAELHPNFVPTDFDP